MASTVGAATKRLSPRRRSSSTSISDDHTTLRPSASASYGLIAKSAQLGCTNTSHATRDRKSTRLNSSHSQISYAVFCLKKKKKNQSIQQHNSKTTNTRYRTRQPS